MTAAEPDAVSGAMSLAEHAGQCERATNPTLTAIDEINVHGHALDHRRWLARVAGTTLAFVQCFI